MAKIKFGGGVSEIRGQLVGNVFSRNTAGAYVRGYSTPNQPESTAQLANRYRFSESSGEWTNLTETQKKAWKNFSLDGQDSLGNSYKISGYQAFMSINKNLKLLDVAPILVPPADAAVDIPLASLEIDTSTELAGPPARKSIIVNFTASPLTEGYRLIVSATAKTTIGRQTQKGRERIISISSDAQTTAWDITSDYEEYFGQMAGADVNKTKIFFLVKIMKASTGIYRVIGRGGTVYGKTLELI